MTGSSEHRGPRLASDNFILGIVAAYAAAFVVFGFLVQPPGGVLRGLGAILTTRDALLTDYFGVGGIGGGCASAGLLASCRGARLLAGGREGNRRVCCGPFSRARLWPVRQESSSTSGRSWRALRFTHNSMASPSVRISIRRSSAARLAPIFSEYCSPPTSRRWSACPLLSRPGSRSASFLAPAAGASLAAHMGFSLYNMGFTAGIVGTIVVAMYKAFGYVPDPGLHLDEWVEHTPRARSSAVALRFNGWRWAGPSTAGALERLPVILKTLGTVPDRLHCACRLRCDARQYGARRSDRRRLRPGDERRSQRPVNWRDPHDRRLRGVWQAPSQHRAHHDRSFHRGLLAQPGQRRRSLVDACGACSERRLRRSRDASASDGESSRASFTRPRR